MGNKHGPLASGIFKKNSTIILEVRPYWNPGDW